MRCEQSQKNKKMKKTINIKSRWWTKNFDSTTDFKQYVQLGQHQIQQRQGPNPLLLSTRQYMNMKHLEHHRHLQDVYNFQIIKEGTQTPTTIHLNITNIPQIKSLTTTCFKQ